MTTQIPDYTYYDNWGSEDMYTRTKPDNQDSLRYLIDQWISDPTQAMFTTSSNTPYYNTIDKWDTSLVTNFGSAFYNKTTFNDDISSWNTSAATQMRFMFYGAIKFNQNISQKDISAANSVTGSAYTAWDVGSVTNMQALFFGNNMEFNNGETALVKIKMENYISGTNGYKSGPSGSDPGFEIENAGSGYATAPTVYIHQPDYLKVGANRVQATATVTVSGGSINTVTITNEGSGYNGYMTRYLSFCTNPLIWDTSSVTSMTQMFYGCRRFNQDVSCFNTSNVKYMSSTFQYNYQFNNAGLDLKTKKITAANSPTGAAYVAWDVSSVQTFQSTFSGSDFNGDISNWRMNPTYQYMSFLRFFQASPFNKDISTKPITAENSPTEAAYVAWDTSRVKTMEETFSYSQFNQDISNWNTSACTKMKGMFYTTPLFDQNIATSPPITAANSVTGSAYTAWDVSSVKNMEEMFEGNGGGRVAFNQDISNWDVSSVTTMKEMFRNATLFNQDITTWKTNGNGMKSNITLTNMFNGATAMLEVNGNVTTPTYTDWETQTICFYGFVNVMTDQGLKQIKDLKRGDMILTNDGYQPLAELDIGFNPSDKLLLSKLKSTDFMVKIPKDFFIENVPSEDVYVTKTHPLSVKIISSDDDKDFEFLHLFVKELMQLGDGIEYVRKDEEKKLYNLIFDKHYEINVGNMKFLSHHPNHLNKNKYLVEGEEKNQENRTKKIYAIEGQCFFDIITLKDLLKQKPGNMTNKEYLGSLIKF